MLTGSGGFDQVDVLGDDRAAPAARPAPPTGLLGSARRGGCGPPAGHPGGRRKYWTVRSSHSVISLLKTWRPRVRLSPITLAASRTIGRWIQAQRLAHLLAALAGQTLPQAGEILPQAAVLAGGIQGADLLPLAFGQRTVPGGLPTGRRSPGASPRCSAPARCARAARRIRKSPPGCPGSALPGRRAHFQDAAIGGEQHSGSSLDVKRLEPAQKASCGAQVALLAQLEELAGWQIGDRHAPPLRSAGCTGYREG